MAECWSCWPKCCNCPPPESELKQWQNDLHIAEQKLIVARNFAHLFLEMWGEMDDFIIAKTPRELELTAMAQRVVEFTR